jgi:uncharacterized membrane protein
MFGKLHPLIVHLPIGILLLNAVLVYLTRLEAYSGAKTILRWTLGIGAASAIIACLTGWFLAENGDYDETIRFRHQYLGISVAVLATILFYFKKQEHLWGSIALAVLLTIAGHYGGTLTHGENYLFAPFGIAAKENTEGGKNKKPTIQDIHKALIFKDLVQPILHEKCLSCHGTSKQKGKLKLDEMANILRGGENGAALVFGQSEQSLLFQRLSLDMQNKKHMPPKGKPQPTSDEIELLKWWISNGSATDKTVAETPQTDNIKTLLASYSKKSNAVTNVHKNDFLPTAQVAKYDEKILETLKKEGIMAIPIAPNSPFLSVNFISKPTANNADIQKLQPIFTQIAWLKLGHTAINDSAIASINQMPNLTKLYLEKTAISDAGIANLKPLTQLQYLNLMGTKITAKGIPPLSKMPILKQIFVFNTAISLKDSGGIKAILPNIEVDFGQYQVPTLVSDTSILKAKVSK